MQRMHWTAQFSPVMAESLAAKYSNTNLIIVQMVIRADPKAMDPQWYLKDHQTLEHTLTLYWVASSWASEPYP